MVKIVVYKNLVLWDNIITVDVDRQPKKGEVIMSQQDQPIKVGDRVSVCIEGRELGEGIVKELTAKINKSALVKFDDGRTMRMNQLWLTVVRRSR